MTARSLFQSGLSFKPAGILALVLFFCPESRAPGAESAGKTDGARPSGNERSAALLLQQALSAAQATSDAQQPLERADIRSLPAKTPAEISGASGLLPSPDALPDDAPAAAMPARNPQGPAGTNKPAPAAKQPVRQESITAPVQAQDPRASVPGEQVNPSAYEPTGLTVNRVFVAADQEGRKISMNVPVYYETRLLGMEKDKQRAAAHLLGKLDDFQKRVAAMQKEGAELLKEWNDIVNASVPKELLMADSPSLVENQGADKINRPAEQPGFEAGKNALVQLKKTTEQSQ
ncbi:MAG: hypothetical protein JO015_06110 [Verrucomicrobia bacterium]|nr:hypothetical protein [Verrucomicrobiota bacterium]